MRNDRQALAESYVYQKWKALKAAKVNRELSEMLKRANLYNKQIEALASMLDAKQLFVDPGVVMQALFDKAYSQRHYDGPFPNSMGNWKYVQSALATYLQIPTDATVEMLSIDRTLERIDETYQKFLPDMQKRTNWMFLSAVPIEYKIKFAIDSDQRQALSYLTEDALTTCMSDPLTRLWIERRVMPYEELAALHNDTTNK